MAAELPAAPGRDDRGEGRRRPGNTECPSFPVIPLPLVSCTPASRVVLLPVLGLLAAFACVGADTWSTPSSREPEVPAGATERVPKKIRIVRNEKAVEVEVGEAIDLVVTRPVSIPSELRYEWPDTPSIAGNAVRFVRLRVEAPPPDVDGGVTTHHYELEAVNPGSARVTLSPRSAGPEAVHPPVLLDVTVRAAGAKDAASVRAATRTAGELQQSTYFRG